MLSKPDSAAPAHRLLLCLTESRLQVVHLRRGLLGWACAHAQELLLDRAAADLSALTEPLRQATRDWGLPVATWVYWVLPGDVLGVVHLASDAVARTELPRHVPFALTELRFAVVKARPGQRQTLLWIHQDWLAELERVTQQQGWRSVELLARADLFEPLLTGPRKPFNLLVEGDTDEAFVHVFDARRVLLRSGRIDAGSAQRLHRALLAEMQSCTATLEPALADLRLWLSPGLLPAPSTAEAGTEAGSSDAGTPLPRHELLPAVELAQRLEALWRSDAEGIELQVTHDALRQRLLQASLALGLLGTLALSAMLWHDEQLVRQIDDVRTQLRKNTGPYEATQALRQESLQMADALALHKTLSAQPSGLEPLADLLGSLPTDTWLYSYRLSGQTVSWAGAHHEPPPPAPPPSVPAPARTKAGGPVPAAAVLSVSKPVPAPTAAAATRPAAASVLPAAATPAATAAASAARPASVPVPAAPQTASAAPAPASAPASGVQDNPRFTQVQATAPPEAIASRYQPFSFQARWQIPPPAKPASAALRAASATPAASAASVPLRPPSAAVAPAASAASLPARPSPAISAPASVPKAKP